MKKDIEGTSEKRLQSKTVETFMPITLLIQAQALLQDTVGNKNLIIFSFPACIADFDFHIVILHAVPSYKERLKKRTSLCS